jgi:hypothetical protein
MKDGSANVQSDSYFGDSTRMKESPIIKEFKVNKNYLASFKISSIDSLGNYFGDIISRNYFSFKYYEDSLVITGKDIEPLQKNWNLLNCHLKVTSEKKIESIRKGNKKVSFKRQEVYMRFRLKKSHPKPIKTTIIFENKNP